MENRAYAIAAGLFAILLTAALVTTALWLRGDTAQRDRYLLVSKLSISGLNPQATVRLRGVEVGKVETIGFDPQDPRLILVRIAVDSSAPITRGTYAQLGYQGITGLSYVQLEDDGTQPELLQTDSDAPARIEVRPSLLDQLGSSGQELISGINQAAKRINILLSDDNQRQLQRTLASLESASGRVASLASGSGIALKRADTLFGNLNRLSVQVEKRLDTLERVARSAEQLSNTGQALGDAIHAGALPKLNGLLDDLSKTSRNLDRLVTDLGEQPQSLVFGKPRSAPGPGESGFTSPRYADE